MIDWRVLEDLSNMGAISGREEAVHDYIKNYVNVEVHKDRLGSSIVSVGENGLSILLAAHTDEVGFLVSKIEDNGFLRVQSVGNMWPHTLLHQVVVVQTKTKKTYKGLFGGPAVHALNNQKRKTVLDLSDLYIDLGVDNKAYVEQLGIAVGDMVYVQATFQEMADNRYLMGKALDNRVSVALGLWFLNKYEQTPLNNKVNVAFTVQEEVGLRGARTSAHLTYPDLALAIDTTLSGDTPFDKTSVQLGKGVAISVIDSMTITNRGLLVYLEQLCEKRGIPYQLSCFTDGGTDAGNIHKTKAGILTTTLMIPIRYMHTHYSVVHKDDIQATFDLLCAIAEDLTVEKYEMIMNDNYNYREEE